MEKSILEKPWSELSFVAFDTETSGPYPLGDEIVEVGLIRWEQGRETKSYSQLIRPQKRLSEEVIKIHGITNEMVQSSPMMGEVIREIASFIGDSILVAHHAPFDMGFLVRDLERFRLSLPEAPALCSSLLARKLIKGTENHKLQTLVQALKIEGGPAHRADSDARSCIQVALHCFQQLGPSVSLGEILKVQEKNLAWRNYSIEDLRVNKDWRGLVEALEKDQLVEFVYTSGSMKGKTREAIPLGLVRNPDGDYFMGICKIENKRKRFYLNSIRDSNVCYK